MFARTAVLVCALVLVPGLAAAQNAMMTVAIQGVPTAPLSVKAGQTQTINFDVNLSGTGFGCAQAAMFNVHLPVSGATSRDTVTNASLAFAVPAGAYVAPPPPPAPAPPVGPYNVTMPGVVTVKPQAGIESGYTIRLTIGADFPGGDFTQRGGCLPAMIPAASAAPVNVQINVQPDIVPPPTPPPGSTPPPGTTPPPPGGNNTGDGDEDGGGIPTPWVAAPFALVLMALVLRRRRSG